MKLRKEGLGDFILNLCYYDNMNYRELVNLGLSEKEAKVYLAALELGKSPVQQIASKAGVNRATTYVIIGSLTKKGLMSSYHEGKKQFFCAEDPEKLNILFRNQEQELERKQNYLKKLLPELEALNISKPEKPVVRYFEGKEGLRAMSAEFYIRSKDKQARMIYSSDLLRKIFSDEEIVAMRRRRQKSKIKVKAIVNDDQKFLVSDSRRYILPASEFPITSDIAFYGNKVRIATQKKPYAGLIIENKEIANTLKLLFDLAWDYADILRKKKKARGVNLDGPKGEN